ncbi:hypothetical protein L1987_50589 [Smallanthus sonchifolius]|uniref:Uncharacterized protein n=1 Tax=Smallanthus sonchifolius TaxID=185202 RepID=A0ACB9ENK3_9ASTR|nr:hypothetical protein L1987_50589 [Smallanthus sonchifolius]
MESVLLGYEVCERMAYYGISTNLVLYLTRELHEGTVKSSNNVTNWGMCLLTLVVSLPSLKPPSCGKHVTYLDCDKRASSFQVGIFYCALYIVAVETWDGWNQAQYLDNGFLDKAAVKIKEVKEPVSKWNLCPVTQVEQTKQMLKMVPILFTTFIPSTLVAQTYTLFIKQGTTLVRSMGPHFEIPPACLAAFITISMLITIVVYDRYFIPLVKKYTKNPRGITLLQRMAVGIALHVIIMIIASLVERRRLNVAKHHGIFQKGGIVPLSIFILLPQFVLVGVADNFLEVGKLEFFYDQAPKGMKSLGTAYFMTSLGVGYFLSSFILSTVANVTGRNGHKGWILDNLNESHLDYYYVLFTVLCLLNFIFFLIAAKNFDYKAEVDGIVKE